MGHVIDAKAVKKPTNVSVNTSLLVEARNLKINLSATLEKALINEVREARSKQWLADNKDALDHCNELAEENGLFADKHRVL